MKIACISDTHGREGWTIPDCDVLIHAGDITAGGTLEETRQFSDALANNFAARNIHPHVLICPGNHDRCLQKEGEEARALFEKHGFHVLINDGIEIEEKIFWASPFTPPFFDWHFMAEEDVLARMYAAFMPDKIDVLITHSPPYGILDPGHDGSRAGSLELRKAVARRIVNHHVFGHLHAAGGKTYYDPKYTETETKYHNVAAVDEAYRLVRQPLVLEI